MIEASRRHGPFDSRYPPKLAGLKFLPASAGRSTGVRRRHDLRAREAPAIAATEAVALGTWEGEGGAPREQRPRRRLAPPASARPSPPADG
jgi:hypothetical protein